MKRNSPPLARKLSRFNVELELAKTCDLADLFASHRQLAGVHSILSEFMAVRAWPSVP